ncbi:MAG: DUF933 domain-containing protein [bacterium]
MRAALIGAPFCGKTTVFESLTGIEPGRKDEIVGTIKVPDNRIEKLASIYKPEKKVYAEFVISDFSFPGAKEDIIPPGVKNLLQKTDLLVIVLRNFESVMTEKSVRPLEELSSIKDEMALGDLVIIEKRLEREQKEKSKMPDIPVLEKLKLILEKGDLPATDSFSEKEKELVSNYNFLSLKKYVVLVNQPEENMTPDEKLVSRIEAEGFAPFSICAPLEKEMKELSAEDALEFLKSYGLSENAGDRFIKNTYKTLGLISFLTTGKDECRAWPVKEGTTALEAAGKIHSDIQRGFIRAETVNFDTFIKLGSEAACRNAGEYRLEGKNYVVKDGDIINFRFNV